MEAQYWWWNVIWCMLRSISDRHLTTCQYVMCTSDRTCCKQKWQYSHQSLTPWKRQCIHVTVTSGVAESMSLGYHETFSNWRNHAGEMRIAHNVVLLTITRVQLTWPAEKWGTKRAFTYPPSSCTHDICIRLCCSAYTCSVHTHQPTSPKEVTKQLLYIKQM